MSSGGLTGKNDQLTDDIYAKQIQIVIENYEIVAHQPNTESGFSATLFQENVTDQYVLAIRGTEGDKWDTISIPKNAWWKDIIEADLSDIVINGIAVNQIIDMYNWFIKLMTMPGEKYKVIERNIVDYKFIDLTDEDIEDEITAFPFSFFTYPLAIMRADVRNLYKVKTETL